MGIYRHWNRPGQIVKTTQLFPFERLRYLEIKKSFNQKATESIDRAFDSLGDSIELVIYLTLEKDYGVSKEDVPLRPEKLSEILTRVFGPRGASL